MKKTLAFLLLICTLLGANTATIASFNALRLGKSRKDYRRMAKVVSHFDLVGLLEVMNRAGVEQLVRVLEKESGEKWGYHLSPWSVGKGEYREYYAYVYRKDKVRFLRESGFYPGQSEYAREPYGADFKIGEFDFTFVLVHIIFGNDESRRRSEIFRLSRVYEYFQGLDPEEQDVVIAGDFNFIALDEAFENLLGHKDRIIHAVDPLIKTTLGAERMANSYDNIFLSLSFTDEFTGKSGALDFTGGDFKGAKEKISDHLPVFIEVDITADDD
ncbi:MAG: endonuclease/exonuclease/phosphatase family protein [Fusobacteriaceae bacterium]|jgi:endonuclease/exonuclease/phosphatase family metal-dependent hydrolase|nr:endonuclease/exonuclease/phosphatase family protein [Fusobacteriaceae bacterium]